MADQAQQSDVAQRYARAFLSLVQEKSALDKVTQDLQNISEWIEKSPDFKSFIGNVTLPRAQQAKAVAALAAKAGFHALTANFLGLLAARRRLPALAGIIAAVQSAVAHHRGEVTAVVASAAALTPSQVKAVSGALEKTLNKKVTIRTVEDPSLIGGMVVTIGSQRIDGSVRSKLDRLHRSLKNTDTTRDASPAREVA